MKVCRSCQKMNIGAGNPGTGPYAEGAGYAKSVELCRPCATEAGWENMHSDDGHDGIANGGGNAEEFGGQAELDRVIEAMKSCWICKPELNHAGFDPTVRVGTTRQGMRLTVPVRAPGKVKAEAVKAQLPEGYSASIRTEKGRTTLRASCKFGGVKLVLHWDAARGGFVSGTAQATNGTFKRVRNASEALRATGV